jgi:hypothetical protein
MGAMEPTQLACKAARARCPSFEHGWHLAQLVMTRRPIGDVKRWQLRLAVIHRVLNRHKLREVSDEVFWSKLCEWRLGGHPLQSPFNSKRLFGLLMDASRVYYGKTAFYHPYDVQSFLAKDKLRVAQLADGSYRMGCGEQYRNTLVATLYANTALQKTVPTVAKIDSKIIEGEFARGALSCKTLIDAWGLEYGCETIRNPICKVWHFNQKWAHVCEPVSSLFLNALLVFDIDK